MPLSPSTSKGGGLPLGLTGATAATRYVGATASGAPASGTFAVGDFSVSQAGLMYVCTVAGSPGTWTAVGASGFTLLSTTVLGSDGTFDVSGISGSYSDLILTGMLRGARVGTIDIALLRFNNDSGSNYATQVGTANATTMAASQTPSSSSAQAIVTINANTATANLFTPFWIHIPGYASTTWIKSGVSLNNWSTGIGTGNLSASYEGFTWNSTAAINRVQIFGNTTANLLTGSALRIYGMS